MFDPAFVQYLASLGVGGIIAGLMFMFYRRDVRRYTEEWKGQSMILISVIRDNTVALTSVVEMTRQIMALEDRRRPPFGDHMPPRPGG